MSDQNRTARPLYDERRAPRGKKWLAAPEDLADTIPRHLRSRYDRWFKEMQAKWGHSLMTMRFDNITTGGEAHVLAAVVNPTSKRYGSIGPGCCVCCEAIDCNPASPMKGDRLWLLPREWLPLKLRESKLVLYAMMCLKCKVKVEAEMQIRVQKQAFEFLLSKILV